MNLTLKLSDILINRNQPRKYFNEESLKELSKSILNDGLQEAILVRPHGDKYEIVQGERRYRACQIANLDTIEVKVKDLNDEDTFHLSVIENIQREQMTAIEEANAYLKYVEMGYTHQEIAEKISKSRDHVTSRMRLLKLSEPLQVWIAQGKITDVHAKQILKMDALFSRMLDPCIFFNKTEDAFEFMQNQFINEFSDQPKITVNEVSEWIDLIRYFLVDAELELIKCFADRDKYYSELAEYNNEYDPIVDKVVLNIEKIIKYIGKMIILLTTLIVRWGVDMTQLNMDDLDFYFDYCMKHKQPEQKSWKIYKAHEEWKELFQKQSFDYDIDTLAKEILSSTENSFDTFYCVT